MTAEQVCWFAAGYCVGLLVSLGINGVLWCVMRRKGE